MRWAIGVLKSEACREQKERHPDGWVSGHCRVLQKVRCMQLTSMKRLFPQHKSMSSRSQQINRIIVQRHALTLLGLSKLSFTLYTFLQWSIGSEGRASQWPQIELHMLSELVITPYQNDLTMSINLLSAQESPNWLEVKLMVVIGVIKLSSKY